MRGEISSGRHAKRHPLDWYVDEIWCARQLALALDRFEVERASDLAIWDPCCGMGNTLQAAWENAAWGTEFAIDTIGSDLVDNFAWPTFDACADLKRPRWFQADFLETTAAPAPCSIICNPPYSYIKGIADGAVGVGRMTCLNNAKADALRFITGFELKNGRCASITDIAVAQFAGDTMLAAGVTTDLIVAGKVRHQARSRDRKLQAVSPVPVPRAPDGEPLFFIRIGGAA